MIEGLRRARPAFLASVTTAAEAEIGLRGGADIIDCKDPSRGALGALEPAIVRKIVAAVAGRAPVSATVGDLPHEPGQICAAVAAMAATGVDVIKIGFFCGGDPRPAISALGELGIKAKLVAVLMADREPDFSLIDSFARYRFSGVMLDTANKASGRLTNVLPRAILASFVSRANAAGLFAGLAGSLRAEDIAPLAGLRPDVLGFRGALCVNGRSTAVDAKKIHEVRDAIDRARRRGEEKSVA